jgi:hypothetical protein
MFRCAATKKEPVPVTSRARAACESCCTKSGFDFASGGRQPTPFGPENLGCPVPVFTCRDSVRISARLIALAPGLTPLAHRSVAVRNLRGAMKNDAAFGFAFGCDLLTAHH